MPGCRNQIAQHAIASRTKQTSLLCPKRAIREQSAQKGFLLPLSLTCLTAPSLAMCSDLPPTRPGSGGDALFSEPLPKAFVHTMNAAQVRAKLCGKRKLRRENGDREEGDRQKKGKQGNHYVQGWPKHSLGS
ncbi:hypothetical protein B0H14DRAFT_3483994 [Mycena olivaceomarginata]|nr:hypothetical protein B0H14DRAFT_3483994 [Mycena olivaceomarginata]